jgi:MATE family multidrug resistance protein
MENSKQPLLSSSGDQSQDQDQLQYSDPVAANTSSAATFVAGAADIPHIKGPADFFTQFLIESKKLWYLAGPAIFTSVCQYSLGAITQVFAGHVSTIALAAVSVENSVIAGFSFGLLVHIYICGIYN